MFVVVPFFLLLLKPRPAWCHPDILRINPQRKQLHDVPSQRTARQQDIAPMLPAGRDLCVSNPGVRPQIPYIRLNRGQQVFVLTHEIFH